MGILEELGFWVEMGKWLVLAYMVFWLYNWTKERLGFSQILTFSVAGILIYFLVIEHPIIGALGIFTWIIISGGLLFFLGMFIPGIAGLFRKI